MYGNKAKLAHSSVDFVKHRYTNVKTIESLLYESVIPKKICANFFNPPIPKPFLRPCFNCIFSPFKSNIKMTIT